MPTLALKPRGDITTSPKTGVSVAQQKDLCPPKKSCKKKEELCDIQFYISFNQITKSVIKR